ncbi:energy-coupling factor transporter transmembrane component T family protein [Halobacterium bonnevillei]|uniref:energy-coupling factor transporter transmembrane component T family protein n=1 Tax=Halobacterium bonnevillei TaxID=2692200 RepID=UPI002D7FBBD9|nr:energy-coupling factor transporter transmembrane component T [Halobacterium bonnevillei]
MTDLGLSYDPGDTVVHRLDARTKLLGQFVVALLAFTWSDSLALPVVWALVLGGMALARVRPRSVLTGYALPFVLLGIATLTRALTLGPPWVDVNAGIEATLHSLRVAAILLASAVYVQTTPVSETQAAISRLVPGKPGQFLAAGTSFVLRFLPVLLADLQSARAAQPGAPRRQAPPPRADADGRARRPEPDVRARGPLLAGAQGAVFRLESHPAANVVHASGLARLPRLRGAAGCRDARLAYSDVSRTIPRLPVLVAFSASSSNASQNLLYVAREIHPHGTD